MICPKCNAQINENTKFCPECGADTSTGVKTLSLRCKACGGTLNVENGNPVMQCPYCGSKELITESDSVAIERIKSQAQKDIELSKLEFEKEKNKEKKFEEKQQKFKKGFLSKLLIILFIICVLLTIYSFSKGNVLQGLIVAVQSALFACAWLLGMQIIKEKVSGLHIIAAVLGFILIVPFFSAVPSAQDKKKSETYVWPSSGICAVLPQPESNNGNIINNSDQSFSLSIYSCTEQQYNDYLNACKEKGFTIDSEISTIGYEAYNSEGYKLRLSFYKSLEDLSIVLDAPKKISEFSWPTSDIAKLLPVPRSNKGSVEWEGSYGFVIYVADTTIEEYKNYVSECEKKGFTVDYRKGDDYFYADNADGYHLSVKYEGNNTIFIRIDEPKKEEQSAAATTSASEQTTADTSSADANASVIDENFVRPEVKEFLDSYEAFMDEYIDFMKKYAESGNSLVMMSDYLDYMQKYAEAIEKLDALDTNGFTNAEMLYYTEVTARVSKKLLDAAL